MILLLGDIHGEAHVLYTAIRKAETVGATAVVQVGDFGLFPKTAPYRDFREVCQEATVPVYFIDGNHDDCIRWTQLTNVARIWRDANLYYVPRGTVMKLDGRTIAFMGGAASIDKEYRLENKIHWDENEDISSEEVKRLYRNARGKTIDILITHTPPTSVVTKHFDPLAKVWFNVGLDWHDSNQDVIEDIWKDLNYPQLYSGHMHKRVVGENYRILDINELVSV